jgi:hypothetical protein
MFLEKGLKDKIQYQPQLMKIYDVAIHIDNELHIYTIILANATYSISLRSLSLFVYSIISSLNVCEPNLRYRTSTPSYCNQPGFGGIMNLDYSNLTLQSIVGPNPVCPYIQCTSDVIHFYDIRLIT